MESSNAHALLSPSGAHRWLVCTPSARFEEQLKEDESEYAEEGTLAHELAALILSSRAGIFKGDQKLYNKMLTSITNHKLYSDEMLDHAEDWAEFVRSQRGEKLLIEHRYDLSEWAPLSSGTADATVIDWDVLYVDDLKYGVGKLVYAKENPQTMMYGLGALRKAHALGYDPSTVVLSIYQPRVNEVADQWELSTKRLLEWGRDYLKPRALLAMGGQGKFVAGDHCTFCKARHNCRAKFMEFEFIDGIGDPREMTERERARVIERGDAVVSFIKSVQTEAVKELQAGRKLKGLKLVKGRPSRAFKNEDEAIEILLAEGYEADQIFDTTLKGITELGKLMGPKKFDKIMEPVVYLKEGKPKAVHEDDARQAICKKGSDVYDDDDEYLDLL